jgi:tryptophan halogenase
MFRHRGRVPIRDEEIFEEAWWACACFGMGLRPARFSIIAEQMSDADLLAQLDKIKRVMRSAVERLPPHREYLQGYLR